MRRMHVQLEDLCAAYEMDGDEVRNYLDLETGDVVAVTDEASGALAVLSKEYGDAAALSADDVRAASETAGHPSWMLELIEGARRVEEGFGVRFIQVPAQRSGEAYEDMDRFIDTLSDPQLQDRLHRAIQGRGAFRRFKDTLLDYPQERVRWFAFHNAAVMDRVLEWLEEIGIEPILA